MIAVWKSGACKRVRIQKPAGWGLRSGQSIAVDGICSTVIAHTRRHFDVEYMGETLSKTTADVFTKGTLLNLERSLSLSSLVDGHLIQGHVDATARVALLEIKENFRLVTLRIGDAQKRYVALHGSIAINGVSLTVARVRGASVSIALIPHTLDQTNLDLLKQGDAVNVEVDMIARYLVALSHSGRVRPNAAKRVRKKS